MRTKIVAPLRGAATTATTTTTTTTSTVRWPQLWYLLYLFPRMGQKVKISAQLKANKIVEHKNSNAASRRSYYFYGKVVSCCISSVFSRQCWRHFAAQRRKEAGIGHQRLLVAGGGRLEEGRRAAAACQRRERNRARARKCGTVCCSTVVVRPAELVGKEITSQADVLRT